MEKSVLERTAALIAKSNLTPRVVGVCVAWEEASAKLVVRYFIDGKVHEDEEEFCELTVAELIAEFPEIRVTDTGCLIYPQGGLSTFDGVVFQRA